MVSVLQVHCNLLSIIVFIFSYNLNISSIYNHMLVGVAPSSIVNYYFLCFLCLKEGWAYTSLQTGPPRPCSGSHHYSVLTPLLCVICIFDCDMLRCITFALIIVKIEQYW